MLALSGNPRIEQKIQDFTEAVRFNRGDLGFMINSSSAIPNAIKPVYPGKPAPKPEPSNSRDRIPGSGSTPPEQWKRNYRDEFDPADHAGKSIGELECYFNNLSNYICKLEQQSPSPEQLIGKLRRRLDGLQAHLDDLKSKEGYYTSIRASGAKRAREMARASGGIACESCGRYCKCARISDAGAYSIDEYYPSDEREPSTQPGADRISCKPASGEGASQSNLQQADEKEESGLKCEEKFDFNEEGN